MHYYNTCIFTNSVLIRKWFVDKEQKIPEISRRKLLSIRFVGYERKFKDILFNSIRVFIMIP